MKLVLALALLVPALQDKPAKPEKDNPQFQYWASWKPGAWTKSKSEAGKDGQKMEMELVAKLLEVSPEKVVVETTGMIKMEGKEFPAPPRKQEMKPKEEQMGEIDKEGDEEIEVVGKKLACHWLLFTQDQQGKKMTSKIWLAKDVPGGVVKREIFLEGTALPVVKVWAVSWGEK